MTANRLTCQYQFEPMFYGINIREVSPLSLMFKREEVGVTHLDESNLETLSECDYVVCCLGGWLLNQVIQTLKSYDTKVISLFPGIVSRYQLDAFVTRVNADEVWLNSPFDHQLYQAVCCSLNMPNNGIVYGANWADDALACTDDVVAQTNIVVPKKKQAVFFEQTEIIDSKYKKDRLKQLLYAVFQNNPDVEFVYKIRGNSLDDYFAELRVHCAQLDNVVLTDTLHKSDVAKSDIYISVSSSALVEGLLLGKRCYLLDEKLLDDYSAEFYHGSNLFLTSEAFLDSGVANETWLYSRVMYPLHEIDIRSVQKRQSLYGMVTHAKNNNLKKSKLREVMDLCEKVVFVLKVHCYIKQSPLFFFKKSQLANLQKVFKYLSVK